MDEEVAYVCHLKEKSFMTIPPFNQTNSSEFLGLRPCGIDIFKTLTDGSMCSHT